MHIKFNDTGRLFSLHKKELSQLFVSIGESGWCLNGQHTKKFSESFANFCGAKYCLPVGNGTDALELALRAIIDDQNETEVITVANAGGYTTTACRLVGTTPVYADIISETQLINPASLLNCLSEHTQAIVITHLYGSAVDVNNIRSMVNSKGYEHVPIIEDCAQAHGAKINGKRVGSLGDLATFSFYPTKNLGAMGDAGALTTSNPEIFNKLKKLAQYGWDTKYSVKTSYGRNSRMDEIQAGILNYLLPFLDENNRQRVSIYNKYKNAAKGSLTFLPTNNYVGHLAIVTTDRRAEFIRHMKDANITTEIHYPILDNEQVAWKKLPHRIDPIIGLKCSDFSISKIVSLPCFPQMTVVEIDHICHALEHWPR